MAEWLALRTYLIEDLTNHLSELSFFILFATKKMMLQSAIVWWLAIRNAPSLLEVG